MDYSPFFQANEWIEFVHETTQVGKWSLAISALSLVFSFFTLILSNSIKKQVRKTSFRNNVINDIDHLNNLCEILLCAPDRLTDLSFLTAKQLENIEAGQIHAFYIETLSWAKGRLSYLSSRYRKTLDKNAKDKIQSAAELINNTILNFHESGLVRCADQIADIIGELYRLQEE